MTNGKLILPTESQIHGDMYVLGGQAWENLSPKGDKASYTEPTFTVFYGVKNLIRERKEGKQR